MIQEKFITSLPTDQNAVDLFKDRWACDLSELNSDLESGRAPLFKKDGRPGALEAILQESGQTLQGMDILEVGPLEAAHTYQLEVLGANTILAIESNTEAFLKCLVVKEIAALNRARFLLGDAEAFMRTTKNRFDLVFACGVLYHMSDPYQFIKEACRVTETVYVWTHFYDESYIPATADGKRTPVEVERDGRSFTYYQRDYGNMSGGGFLGGLEQLSSWVTFEDMTTFFNMQGFSVDLMKMHESHRNGPAVTFIARRS